MTKEAVIEKTEIKSLFDEWNRAIRTGDPAGVAELYVQHGVLVPTLSGRVRKNRKQIREYFEDFLSREPTARMEEANIRIFGDLAINSGLYSFTFRDGTTAPARFTFVYQWNGERWMIVEHHSSLMPE
ncbi:MAG: SgcJ/EcaC family oxidoreductase [Desulfobacteraceae bacterium]